MSYRTQVFSQSVSDSRPAARLRHAGRPSPTLPARAGRSAATVALAAAVAFGARAAPAHAQATLQSASARVSVPLVANAPAITRAAVRVGPMPAGWAAVGRGAGEYVGGSDLSRRDGGSGERGATIRSLTADPLGYMGLAQSVRADLYRGQRVRLSGFVKSATDADVVDAGLWMRVDGPTTSESDYLATLERQPAAVHGTEWARYDVVLDVPRGAVGITFGALLNGPGQLWVDDVRLERVGGDVPLTAHPGGLTAVRTDAAARHSSAFQRQTQLRAYENAPLRPVNVDFREGTGKS